jgi:hypothetical protein
MELSRATPEQYEKLKQLGFPINTISKNPTPTLAFVLMWFRRTYDLHIGVFIDDHKFSYEIIHGNESVGSGGWDYESHEECESAGIDFALDYLSNNKKQ